MLSDLAEMKEAAEKLLLLSNQALKIIF